MLKCVLRAAYVSVSKWDLGLIRTINIVEMEIIMCAGLLEL